MDDLSKHTILIVEDSNMYGNMLIRSIKKELGYDTIWAKSYQEALAMMTEASDITVALVDLVLPDALNGEIVDLVIGFGLPTVIVTSNISNDIQEFVWTKKVVDYVIKDGGHSIEYLIEVVDRVVKNRDTGVLIVDDSAFARSHLRALLEIQRFKIFEAENGLEALEILDEEESIKLVLTDYSMPECDGFEFIKRARRKFHLGNLAIIGLSSHSNHEVAVKLIKSGANDFLSKPFIPEQIYCRINQNIKIVEQFEHLKAVSLIDSLTNIYNRKYLFETGTVIFENALRNKIIPVVAMVDIDHFKKINDNYGHLTGDIIIKRVAQILKKKFRKSDIVARFGGEEFCVIANNMDPAAVSKVFNEVREAISSVVFNHEGEDFSITVSIGVCTELKESFNAMIKHADEMLYKAKDGGRNKVVF